MADKITLNDLASLDTPSVVNSNFDVIETAFDNTLSRDGTTPNQMEADFDLNSNRLLNGGRADFTSLFVNGFEIKSSDDVGSGSGGGGAGTIVIDGNTSDTLIVGGTGVSSSYDAATQTTTLTFTAGTGGGGGGTDIEVEGQGVSLTTGVTKFNFAGAGVVVTEPAADEILVTIAGGGSGGLTTDGAATTLAELQTAITAAAGGTVFITKDWSVTSTLNVPANTTIFGAGGSFTNTANVVMFNTANGVQLKHLDLTGSGTSASATTQDVAISIASDSNVIVESCTFDNFEGYTIYVNVGTNTTLRNLKFTGSGNYCIFATANTDHTVIQNIEMDGCAGGINLDGSSGSEITNTLISGLKWDGTGTTGSLHLLSFDHADYGQISNVEALYIRGRASNMSNSDYWNVSNNHISNACQDGTTDYVFYYDDCWRWTHLQQVYNDEAPGSQYAYYFVDVNIGHTYIGCDIHGSGAGSIVADVADGTNASRSLVAHSAGLSFGRWTDKTISSGAISTDSYNNQYRIVGTGTTLADINGGYLGQRIMLRSNASGTVTISNTGNIKTPEGTNLNLNPNGSGGAATIELIQVSTGVWEVIGTAT